MDGDVFGNGIVVVVFAIVSAGDIESATYSHVKSNDGFLKPTGLVGVELGVFETLFCHELLLREDCDSTEVTTCHVTGLLVREQ